MVNNYIINMNKHRLINNLINQFQYLKFYKNKSYYNQSFIRFRNNLYYSTMVEKDKTKKDDKKSTVNWDNALQNVVVGQVVTRFPPEPSGYLHIGHLKAVILNRYLADKHQGKMVLRFDDTNPENESQEFVDIILDDLKKAGIKIDGEIDYVTNHFDKLENHMTKLIESGDCYCDNTPIDVMREYRDKGVKSPCRDQSPEENMKIWLQMKDPSLDDKEIRKYCVRGKINYLDKNKCLRDPVFYRFNDKEHYRLGNKYKLYPTYDFAIAIVDNINQVTHLLRTNEYSDRVPMFRWVEEKIGLPKMNIFEYSRLNLKYTVLSKRKLRWLVNNNKVDSWDDPRLPTLRGILRKGITMDALKAFILEIGPSTNTVFMEWDKIYALNKDIIDPMSKRIFAVSSENPVCVEILNFNELKLEESATVDWHQKVDLGKRTQYRSHKLFIEPEDAEGVEEGIKLTLYKWGNSRVKKVIKGNEGKITEIHIDLTPEDQDFKKTKVVHWVSANPEHVSIKLYQFREVVTYEYDDIITKEKLEDEDDIKDFVNEKSKFKHVLLAERCIDELNERSFVQFERRGYYVIDSKNKTDIVLNYIPDGKSSSCSVIKKKVPPKPVVVVESKKSKKQEKTEDKNTDKKDKKDKKEKVVTNTENTEDKK